MPGAGFLLLDSAGQEAGRGTTDAQGKLTSSDLAPGVYRLKETASGFDGREFVSSKFDHRRPEACKTDPGTCWATARVAQSTGPGPPEATAR